MKIKIAGFVIVAMVQLYVPVSMVWEREQVLHEGTVYKFRVQPVDPADPFRGRYITLSFMDDVFDVDDTEGWERHQEVYVVPAKDEEGFMKIKEIVKEAPSGNNYFHATVQYTQDHRACQVVLDYPFNRFYMQEEKAPKAENKLRELGDDVDCWAEVAIQHGRAVVKDVKIGGVSVSQLTEE